MRRRRTKNKASHKIQNIKSRNRCIDLIVANNNSPKSEQYNKIRNVTKRIYLASTLAGWLAIRGGTNQKIKRRRREKKTNRHDNTKQTRETVALAFASMSETLLTNKIPKSLTFLFVAAAASATSIYCCRFYLCEKKRRENNFGILLYCNYYR